jgi:lipopolysaccharide export system permease protein
MPKQVRHDNKALMKELYYKYIKVIDRYIIRKYLGTFVFTLGIFIVISVVFDISEHLDNFLSHHATIEQIAFQYYAGFIPFYINMLSPLINFLAVIFFTAKMANQTEIVPILSGKASFNRFLRPYFIASFLIFMVSFFANVYLIPYTNRLKNDFENSHGFNGDQDPTKTKVHLKLDSHTYIYMDQFDALTHTGYTFILEKFNGDELKEKLYAPTITFDSLKKVWSLNNCIIRYVNGLREKQVSGIHLDTTLDMRPSDFDVLHDDTYDAMSLSILNSDIAKERIRGSGVLNNMLYEKYNRFIYPFSTFVLTLIGVSISSRKVRGGIGLPLGVGIFLCFGYIIVNKFAFVFAEKGAMTPLLAAFMPNVIFGLMGYYLLARAPK